MAFDFNSFDTSSFGTDSYDTSSFDSSGSSLADMSGSSDPSFDMSIVGPDAPSGSSSDGSSSGSTMGSNFGNLFGSALNSGLVSNLIGIGGDKYQFNQAGKIAEAGKAGANFDNPFATYRNQYGLELAKLMANPSSITDDPSYQFQLKQGEQALIREQGAEGKIGGGASGLELEKYGQDYAASALTTKENQLAQLAGANFTPSGGSLMLQGQMGTNTTKSGAVNDAAGGVAAQAQGGGDSGGGINWGKTIGTVASIVGLFL